MKSFFFCFFTLITVGFSAYAQDNASTNARPDSVSRQVENLPVADSTAFSDNTQAVELIMRLQNEEATTSLKESLLSDQLNSFEGDARQRRVVERQLEELRVADSIRVTQQRHQIDSLKKTAVGAPVLLKRDTIYYIYTRLGSFTPAERAESDSEKILKTARQFSLKTDSLVIMDSGTSSEIMCRDITLVSITDPDALWMNTTRGELALLYKEKILESIADYKKEMGVLNILKLISLTLLILLMLFGLIKGTSYLFLQIIDKKITTTLAGRLKGIKFRDFELLDRAKQVKMLLFLSRITRYLVYIILFYLTIPMLFSVFPMTQRYAQTLFSWILSPIGSILSGLVSYLPKLIRIIIIVLFVRYVLKFFRYIANEIESGRMTIPGFYPDWAKATFNLLRIFLYAFTLALVFPLLPGSDSDIFKGVSVLLGLLFSLGSTTVIANLMAGMVITYMRSFKVGDRIRVGEVFGDVVEKTPFVIRVITHKKEIVTVPNSTILSSNVTNYSTSAHEAGVILYTTVTMGYGVPWRQVEELLIQAGLKTKHVLETPAPFVLQLELNDFSASYQLCVYTKEPQLQADIYSEINKNIQDVFAAAGIELLNPHYQAIRDGNKSVVPPQEKGK